MNPQRYPIRISCLLPLASVLATAVGVSHAAGNVVPNGDFEAPSATDANRPAAWKSSTSGKVSVAWPGGEGCRASRCLRMTCDPNDRWGHAYWLSDEFPLRPGMAYRVRFSHRASGWGTPCFTLFKVKAWRLSPGDKGGCWLLHEDVVVVPPDVTKARFSVNNYHRPGKTMWLDDLSIVELPLSESPLTHRLDAIRRDVAAIRRNTAGMQLSAEHHATLGKLTDALREAGAAYGKLEAGSTTRTVLGRLHENLATAEKAAATFVYTLWATSPRSQGPLARPSTVTRHLAFDPPLDANHALQCRFALQAFVADGVPLRIATERTRAARDWDLRLFVRATGRTERWGRLGPLNTLYLPAGRRRDIRLDARPRAGTGARPRPAELRLLVQTLDRTAEDGSITIRLVAPAAP